MKQKFEPEEHIEMMLYPELIAVSFRKNTFSFYPCGKAVNSVDDLLTTP